MSLLAATSAEPRRRAKHLSRRRNLDSRQKCNWSAEDVSKLRAMWGDSKIETIAQELKRTPIGVYCYAKLIGLPLGVPQGYESVTAACERTGYGLHQLRVILRWGGVSTRVIPTAITATKSHRQRCVVPFDVDEAIRGWTRLETFAMAARRHGYSPSTMRRWLREAKVTIWRTKDNKLTHCRVDRDDVDRVVRDNTAHETLKDAARRVGVSTVTLSLWLTEAGLSMVGRVWVLTEAEVDRVVSERMARPTCRAKGRAK